MANVTKCAPHKVCISSSKLQSDDATPLYPHINTKKFGSLPLGSFTFELL
jgi:hypothetical protein